MVPSHVTTSQPHVTLTLKGRFDAHEVPAFRAAIDREILDGARVLVLELERVVFIDSSALAELVRAQRSLHLLGGSIRIASLSDPVRVILEVTGLGSVLLSDTP